MNNRFLNRIKDYHFGRCLIHLYQLKGIDTSISSRGRGRDAGWATGVATEMFNLGLLEFNDKRLGADAEGERIKQKNSTARRLQEHLKVASAENISGKWLSIYCGYFECSCDYLMGYIEKLTYQDTDIYKETGLEENSIRTLQEIQKTDEIENSITIFPHNLWTKMIKNEKMTSKEEEEFEKIFFDTPEENIKPYPSGHIKLMDLLNFLLSNNYQAEQLLIAFRNLVNPYTVPVFYDDKNGWTFLDNQWSKDVGFNGHITYTINLASDEKKPDDNLPIWITKDFLDSVNMKSIENVFRDFCNNYRKKQNKKQ